MPALMSAEDAALEMVEGIDEGSSTSISPGALRIGMRLARLLPYRWYFWLIHKVTGL
jgi:hypothetical protein